EQRVHVAVKQRQPMLHTGVAPRRRHRLVKRIVALAGAEQLDIALAEMLDRLELPDAFKRIAEKVEADGARMARREKIENAAADCVFAGLHHGSGPPETRGLKPLN